MKTLTEIDIHIQSGIQGVFGGEVEMLRAEVEKLKPGQVYLEIGVDEGRSFSFAYYLAKKGVYVVGIDIHDVPPHEKSVGRGPWAEQEGMIGIGKRGFFIHGDADEFAPLWTKPIDLMFLDPHHDYESIKQNTLNWEPKMRKGGVILFHDYDHPETRQWLDEHYGDKKEVFAGKMVKVIV